MTDGCPDLGRDKTGKMRIQCSRHRESRGCPDPVMTYVEVVERKVIDRVIGLFSSPEDINVLLKSARAEARKQTGDKVTERSKLERRSGELDREVERLTDLLMRGVGVEAVLDQRVKAAYTEKTQIETKLAGLSNEQSDSVINIHPAALKMVLSCATELRAVMERGDMEGDHALSEAFRFFLHSVVVNKADGWRKEPTVEIRSPWVAFNATPPTVRATAPGLSGGLMVAEVRYFFYPPMKHRWFRLGPTGFSPHHNARFTPDLCGRSIGHPETMRADRCRSKMFIISYVQVWISSLLAHSTGTVLINLCGQPSFIEFDIASSCPAVPPFLAQNFV